jgi:DNA-binding CsgD family transcriptional regulator
LALAGRAFVTAYAGEATEARHAAETAIELFQRGSVTVPSLWPIATLGFLDLSQDAFEPAARQLAPMAAGAASMGVREPVVLTFAADAAEALIALGRTDEARAIVDDLETAGRRLDRAWALAAGGRCRALLLAADGDLEAAIDAAVQALVQHERIAMPFERARTLLVLGRLQRRHGKRRAAGDTLREAVRAFEDLGTALWAKKARGELQRLGVTPGETWDLTPSERRIAEMAAGGLTNRQVAAAILVSPKTVEASLARVYRKLDIRSRAELGRRMAEGGLSKARPGDE